ncbi:hypothetical protein [Micrococcus sp. HSID17227]|uniref:hypothetical protein n=1 Tax=Micrococcus sp. HSID17227 TaxID=2419506 RepID=UPI0015763E88
MAGGRVGNVEGTGALPCATQNELDESAARTLLKNGVKAVAEGAASPGSPGSFAPTGSRKAGIRSASAVAPNSAEKTSTDARARRFAAADREAWSSASKSTPVNTR